MEKTTHLSRASMNPQENKPDLRLCLDLSVPPGVQLGAWATSGEISVTESADGRRFMVFATPGASCFLMGFPAALPDDPEQLRQWYANHPVAQPVWFTVDEFGEALRLPGKQPFPREVKADPRFQAIRQIVRREERRQESADLAEGESAVARGPDTADVEGAVSETPSSLPETEQGAEPVVSELQPVLSVPRVVGARPVVVSLGGEPIRIEQDAEGVIVFAGNGTSFVLAQVPEDDRALGEFFDEQLQARAMAYAVVDGNSEVSLSALAAFERRIARRGTEGLEPIWEDVLRESEAARSRELARVAVPARALRRYVKENAQAPRAIQGSDGTLYAMLADVSHFDAMPRVKGVVPDGAASQVLRVDIAAEHGLDSVFYAPAGGAYLLVSADAAAEADAPGNATGIVIRPGGDRMHVAATERARIWAEAKPLEIVHANPSRSQLSELRAESTASVPPETAGEPIPVPPPDLWDGPLPDPDPEEIENRAVYSAEDVRSVPSEVQPARWHGPEEGATSLRNWRRLSPRGELWMAELLTVLVDRTEDLDALGCLVPIQMLRQGYGLTVVDKERFQHAVDGPLADRLSDVRVFEIDGQSFFARDTAQGVRLIGPRGAPVKSPDIRAAILAAYGRGPDAPVVDPKPYQHPSSSRLSSRESQRGVAR